MNNEYEKAEEMDGERTIDLREIFALLLSKALWILFSLAVCVAGAVIYTKAFVKPQYKATAVIYVNDGNMTSTGSVAIATYLAEDYAKTIKLRTVVEAAIDNLALNMSYQEVVGKINVYLERESRIVEITLVDDSPARAQALCNEICYVSKDRFENMTDVKRVSIYEEAAFPVSPSSPMMKNVFLAAVIGFILPCAIIFLIYMIDDRINTPQDIQRALKLSTMGNIPFSKE